MVIVSAWGRLQHSPHQWVTLSDRDNLLQDMHTPGLAYGMGRSYGDVCLNPDGFLWSTQGLQRFIQFDETTGRLLCEAGILLRDIQTLFTPRGWMLPVTPGTQMVTVGGAIANDVHGKNHHRAGCFSQHVHQFSLQRSDGQRLNCSPTQHANWFAATVGGLGLTGVIATVELQLRRVCGPWMQCETIPYQNLGEFFTLSKASEADWEYTVSWIDCLSNGRGIFMRANHADQQDLAPPQNKTRNMPFTPPCSLVNHATLWAFNQLYFHGKKWQAGTSLMHYRPFFYPLDHLAHWNRMYGPRGFYQYQCVVPPQHGPDAVAQMLQTIKRAGDGSFLAVLKTFGAQPSSGLLSFPQPGVTLALDFANRGTATLKLFEQLDNIVQQAGGRLYPAKDARMSRASFVAGYPRLPEFLTYRDPGISSALARRLMDNHV